MPTPPTSSTHFATLPTVAQVLAEGTPGAPLTVAGWVRSVRHSKTCAFVALGDGSTPATLQVVVPAEAQALQAPLARLGTGASARFVGTLVASPAKGQAVELTADAIEVFGEADAETYPLQKKGHTLDFLRTLPHLRGRSNTFAAVFRLRSALAQTVHAYFAARGFAHVHTPIVTTSDTEGAGELFEVHSASRGAGVPFFGRPAFLTVSGQLAGESLAYALGRIYTFGPTFRAENSNTSRHLAEFWMIEPEMAFFDAAQNRALAEDFLKCTIGEVLGACGADVAFLAKHYDKELEPTLRQLVDRPFARITYTEAVETLARAGKKVTPVRWGEDLGAEQERFLTEQHCRGPLVVTDYPKGLKAFYMYQNDDDKTVGAMDVLVPRIGELIGGSQREHRLDRLTARLGAETAAYDWYLDQHRFGAVPHAGFGLGFERLVMLCTGMANIRDVVAFPRAPDLAPG